MLNFIAIMAAIYLALVGAAVTIIMVCASNWYVKKATKIATKSMEEFCKED